MKDEHRSSTALIMFAFSLSQTTVQVKMPSGKRDLEEKYSLAEDRKEKREVVY